ncbi:MAG: diacylglycerol kinase family protein, partial [Bacilli bacterium]|nr:diacylglycerol kinase family protein [Bacilli bacterium]
FLDELKGKKNIRIEEAVGLDYKKFFLSLQPNDEVVMVGGDGTLNYLINHVDCDSLKNNVYLRPCGTGNDFLTDIEGKSEEILINKYLKNLPTVIVNGERYKFINGVGYGIDGYCCEVADKIKEKQPNKAINYAGIAIKGILFHFKPKTATVVVDGVQSVHKKVWLAPSMKGKYYGGGMKIAPSQDRNSKTLSVVVYKTPSNLKALAIFPSVFKGEHIKKDKVVKIYTGKEITVKFDAPCALQIDGETVLGVTEYTVKA